MFLGIPPHIFGSFLSHSLRFRCPLQHKCLENPASKWFLFLKVWGEPGNKYNSFVAWSEFVSNWRRNVIAFLQKYSNQVHLSNRPFYVRVLSYLAYECTWGWKWPCCYTNLSAFLIWMPHQNNLIYTTKAVNSLSKQGHLQPHWHSKVRSLNRQL